MSGSGISWAICKSAPRNRTDSHASTPTTLFFTGRMPFLPPNQQRQSTEGTKVNKWTKKNVYCNTRGLIEQGVLGIVIGVVIGSD